MTKFPLICILLLAANLVFGQKTYYTFNNGVFLSEQRVQDAVDKATATLPANYQLAAVIYHKVLKKDSTVNYIAFRAKKADPNSTRERPGFIFEQDSIFLLLDKKLPEFSLRDFNGNEFSSKELIGKPTLLDFWATWCGPCIQEMPDLNSLKHQFGAEVNFIALTENRLIEDDLENFLKKNPFSYYHLEDAMEL